MKVGEYGMIIEGEILQSNGEPLDLTEATNVKLILKLKKTVYVKDCVIIDAKEGLVEYEIEKGLLNVSGTLSMEIVVDYGNNDRFKSKGYIKQKVERALEL